MIWFNLTYNGEEGYRKVRLCAPRVPVVGERFEFWNPDGTAADVAPELNGNVFFVAEVTWVAHSQEGGAIAEPNVFVTPKSEWEG